MVVEPGEDFVDIAQNPDVLGWGLHMHDALLSTVHSAVVREFGRIWLGCIH